MGARRGNLTPHASRGEPHEGPRGYSRVTEPKGWNKRPRRWIAPPISTISRRRAATTSGRIGARRAGRAHRWGYGEILPRAYWAPQYLIADYWLFALEVPPAGYEWVRDGNDALLVNTIPAKSCRSNTACSPDGAGTARGRVARRGARP